jgi:signal transduction histidine kinase
VRVKPWAAYLAVGAVAVGGYVASPAGGRALLEVGVGASAVAAIAAGVRRHRPAQPAAWWLLGAGTGVIVLGDAVFYGRKLVWHAPPFPSVADGFYLAGYLLVAAGLLVLIRRRSPRRDWAALLDGMIIAVGVGLLEWVLVAAPSIRDTSLDLAQRSLALAYPACDVLLLALAARLIIVPGRRSAAYPLLLAGLGFVLLADVLVAVGAFAEAQAGGVGLAEAGFLVAYVLVGAAALHPSMVALAEPAPPRPARGGGARLLALGAACLVAPCLLVVQGVEGAGIDVGAIAAGWVALLALVAARVVGLVRDIGRAEAERRRLLDRTVQAAEQERVQIAADLHDGPIQRLTALSFELERVRRRLAGAGATVGVERLERAQETLSAEVQRLRELMASLRPPVLDEVGLEAALRDHVHAFARRSGVACEVRLALGGPLGADLETVLYQVAQEALLNVARHAHAARLRLDLAADGDRVELEIRDNGVGFAPLPSSVLVREGHFGLVGMRERVELAGGRFDLASRPGGGVTIRARFPAAA